MVARRAVTPRFVALLTHRSLVRDVSLSQQAEETIGAARMGRAGEPDILVPALTQSGPSYVGVAELADALA
jgi:hypothetical protein